MSGHSKWANIKHRKGAQDAKRSVIFSKLARAIEIAAKGGADPDHNLRLKLAVEKARAANMPSNNVEKAIRKGAGLDKEKSQLVETVYEGFGPGNTAVIVEAVTDNRNRTSAEMRHLFSQYGGSLASAGSVMWQFISKGKLSLVKDKSREEELTFLAIDLGVLDVQDEGETISLYTDPKNLMAVKHKLESAGFKIKEASIVLVANSIVSVENPDEARKLLKLMEALDEHPDVKEVFSNFDIPDNLLENLA